MIFAGRNHVSGGAWGGFGEAPGRLRDGVGRRAKKEKEKKTDKKIKI